METSRGFTLIELMITLLVASILVTLAAPSFSNFIKDNRLTAQANTFIASVNLARSEAIKRGTSVYITSNNGTNWNGGWKVWVDQDGDTSYDSGEELRVEPAFDGPSTLAGTQSTFTFNAEGLIDNTDTLKLCDDRTGETGRRIEIKATGRISIYTLTCA